MQGPPLGVPARQSPAQASPLRQSSSSPRGPFSPTVILTLKPSASVVFDDTGPAVAGSTELKENKQAFLPTQGIPTDPIPTRGTTTSTTTRPAIFPTSQVAATATTSTTCTNVGKTSMRNAKVSTTIPATSQVGNSSTTQGGATTAYGTTNLPPETGNSTTTTSEKKFVKCNPPPDVHFKTKPNVKIVFCESPQGEQRNISGVSQAAAPSGVVPKSAGLPARGPVSSNFERASVRPDGLKSAKVEHQDNGIAAPRNLLTTSATSSASSGSHCSDGVSLGVPLPPQHERQSRAAQDGTTTDAGIRYLGLFDANCREVFEDERTGQLFTLAVPGESGSEQRRLPVVPAAGNSRSSNANGADSLVTLFTAAGQSIRYVQESVRPSSSSAVSSKRSVCTSAYSLPGATGSSALLRGGSTSSTAGAEPRNAEKYTDYTGDAAPRRGSRSSARPPLLADSSTPTFDDLRRHYSSSGSVDHRNRTPSPSALLEKNLSAGVNGIRELSNSMRRLSQGHAADPSPKRRKTPFGAVDLFSPPAGVDEHSVSSRMTDHGESDFVTADEDGDLAHTLEDHFAKGAGKKGKENSSSKSDAMALSSSSGKGGVSALSNGRNAELLHDRAAVNNTEGTGSEMKRTSIGSSGKARVRDEDRKSAFGGGKGKDGGSAGAPSREADLHGEPEADPMEKDGFADYDHLVGADDHDYLLGDEDHDFDSGTGNKGSSSYEKGFGKKGKGSKDGWPSHDKNSSYNKGAGAYVRGGKGSESRSFLSSSGLVLRNNSFKSPSSTRRGRSKTPKFGRDIDAAMAQRLASREVAKTPAELGHANFSTSTTSGERRSDRARMQPLDHSRRGARILPQAGQAQTTFVDEGLMGGYYDPPATPRYGISFLGVGATPERPALHDDPLREIDASTSFQRPLGGDANFLGSAASSPDDMDGLHRGRAKRKRRQRREWEIVEERNRGLPRKLWGRQEHAQPALVYLPDAAHSPGVEQRQSDFEELHGNFFYNEADDPFGDGGKGGDRHDQNDGLRSFTTSGRTALPLMDRSRTPNRPGAGIRANTLNGSSGSSSACITYTSSSSSSTAAGNGRNTAMKQAMKTVSAISTKSGAKPNNGAVSSSMKSATSSCSSSTIKKSAPASNRKSSSSTSSGATTCSSHFGSRGAVQASKIPSEQQQDKHKKESGELQSKKKSSSQKKSSGEIDMGNIDVGSFDLRPAITIGKPSPTAKLPPHLQKFLIKKPDDYVPNGSSDSNAATPAASLEASPVAEGHGEVSPLSPQSLQRAMDGRHRMTYIHRGRVKYDGSAMPRPSPIPECSHEDSASRSDQRSSASSSLTGGKKQQPPFSRTSSSEMPRMDNLGTSAEEEEDMEEMMGTKRSKTIASSFDNGSKRTSANAVPRNRVKEVQGRQEYAKDRRVKTGDKKSLAKMNAQIRGNKGRYGPTKVVRKTHKDAKAKASGPKMNTAMNQELSTGKQTTSASSSMKTATTTAMKTLGTASSKMKTTRSSPAGMKSSNSTSTTSASSSMKTVSRTLATAKGGKKGASSSKTASSHVSTRGVEFISTGAAESPESKGNGSDEDDTFEVPSPPSDFKRVWGQGKKAQQDSSKKNKQPKDFSGGGGGTTTGGLRAQENRKEVGDRVVHHDREVHKKDLRSNGLYFEDPKSVKMNTAELVREQAKNRKKQDKATGLTELKPGERRRFGIRKNSSNAGATLIRVVPQHSKSRPSSSSNKGGVADSVEIEETSEKKKSFFDIADVVFLVPGRTIWLRNCSSSHSAYFFLEKNS
ncbi:unnamed protein product [Amoebophrya sp. A25]|nr:unnamed protein product [Amoebophrya sp. A25]|eukprot:GSA25T00018939001.1